MQSLKLDFLHPHPRPHWAAWVLLAAGLGMALNSGWQGQQAQKALDQAVAAAPPQAVGAASRAGSPTLGQAQASVRLDREQLAAPWGNLFVRLETHRPKNIALIALGADAGKTEATLTAEARSAKDMLDYIEQLKGEAGFSSVTLASHTLQENDPQLPLRFILRLAWKN